MKSTKTIALLVSLVVGIFLLLMVLWGGVWKAHWVAGALALSIGLYYLVLWILVKFVELRIKPLYEMIGQRDSHNAKNIVTLEGDIRAWAEKSRVQMETLKSMELYRKEFLGDVSHELKTPLFSLQGYVDILMGGVDNHDDAAKYLERCDKNIERLINIVNDLEDISKLEEQNMILFHSDFDIVSMFKDVSDSINSLACERSIKINVMSKYGLFVRADKERIEQIVVNLLSNAVKYNVDGGGVDVYFDDLFDKICVRVSDTGVGIPNEHLNRIFERFYRVDKGRSRQAGGTGLGLAIVKHIIEAHKETISVSSSDKGSTFSFTLSKSNDR